MDTSHSSQVEQFKPDLSSTTTTTMPFLASHSTNLLLAVVDGMSNARPIVQDDNSILYQTIVYCITIPLFILTTLGKFILSLMLQYF